MKQKQMTIQIDGVQHTTTIEVFETIREAIDKMGQHEVLRWINAGAIQKQQYRFIKEVRGQR